MRNLFSTQKKVHLHPHNVAQPTLMIQFVTSWIKEKILKTMMMTKKKILVSFLLTSNVKKANLHEKRQNKSSLEENFDEFFRDLWVLSGIILIKILFLRLTMRAKEKEPENVIFNLSNVRRRWQNSHMSQCLESRRCRCFMFAKSINVLSLAAESAGFKVIAKIFNIFTIVSPFSGHDDSAFFLCYFILQISNCTWNISRSLLINKNKFFNLFSLVRSSLCCLGPGAHYMCESMKILIIFWLWIDFIHSLFSSIRSDSSTTTTKILNFPHLSLSPHHRTIDILMSMSDFFPPNKHIQSFFPFFQAFLLALSITFSDSQSSECIRRERERIFIDFSSSSRLMLSGKVFFCLKKKKLKIDLLHHRSRFNFSFAVSDIFVNKLRTLDAVTHKFSNIASEQQAGKFTLSEKSQINQRCDMRLAFVQHFIRISVRLARCFSNFGFPLLAQVVAMPHCTFMNEKLFIRIAWFSTHCVFFPAVCAHSNTISFSPILMTC